MLKELARRFTPPIVWDGAKSLKPFLLPSNPETPMLFDGDDEVFLAALRDARVYFEYGVGLSTNWVDQNTDARIVSVDTSREWIDHVKASLSRDGHSINFIDLGPIGNWGMPESFEKRDKFIDYVEGPWSFASDADVVLIDGRFRIACFLNSLLRANAGTKIIFDDYAERKSLHVVSEYLAPSMVAARQALFIVPDSLDTKSITEARDAFLMVRD